MGPPASGGSSQGLATGSVLSELKKLARAWGGARGETAKECDKLRALLEVARESDGLPGLTLAELINSAMSIDRSEWRAVAVILLDVDVSQKPTSMSKRHARLVKKCDAYPFKSDKPLRSRATIRGNKTVIELALEFAAEMLVRYRDGDRPRPAGSWRLDPDGALADIETSLGGAATGIGKLAFPLVLDHELRIVLAETHGSLRWLQNGRCFLASSPALELRRELHDKDDTLYILSRRDEADGVVQDPRWPAYTRWISDEVKAIRASGDTAAGINHVRLVVRRDPESLEAADDDLHQFHGINSLYAIATTPLGDHHGELHELSYGFAVSKNREFALISGPNISPYRHFISDRCDIRELARHWCARPTTGGPIRSLVVIDTEYINQLRTVFLAALRNRFTTLLK